MRAAALIGALLVLVVAAPAGANVLFNGDWEMGQIAWTQVSSDWGSDMAWTVTNNGPTAPEGTLTCTTGSFGWFQVAEVPVGQEAAVTADWSGNDISWAEVMLWTVPVGTTLEDVEATFDSGPAEAIAYKKDAFGMNPPTTWDWEPAALSPHPSGNGGTVISQGLVVVGLKLGGQANSPSLSFDNIVLTPEPAAALLLGLPIVFLRRRRS